MKLSRILVSFSVCLFSFAATTSAQTIEISPSRVMVDEVPAIHVTGLQSNEHVSIRASLADGSGENWSSQAEFVADTQGNIDLSKQAPVSGSYKEISTLGLVWSMAPADKHVGFYAGQHNLGPQSITFTLLRNGSEISHAELVQQWIADGAKDVKIEGQIHGRLFLPSGVGPHPAVLVLGGSEGGAPFAKAAWLASHGYAALALAYFRYEGLPDQLQDIPLEYFGRALGWMTQRPEIQADHIGVMGTSRGGELALQLGSMYPTIKAVVAYVPASYRHGACCGRTGVRYAWTWQGSPLPFARMYEHDQSALMPATIAVEHTRGPIMLIAGEDDAIWDSPAMTIAIVNRLKQTHFAYDVERDAYPHAGHRVGRPEIVPAWAGEVRHPVSGMVEKFGGTVEGNALSSLDSIPKVLTFLQKNLADGSSQAPMQAPAKPN